MIGWRQCAGCKKELPEEFYRGDNPQCRTCAREAQQRHPVVKLAPGVTAQLKEAWAHRVLQSIGAL